jgi:hypothetical protein
LLTGSLPPTNLAKQEQKISDNSLVVVFIIPMRSLIRSRWNLPLLVELKWRSYLRRLMVSEVVFCQGAVFMPSQNHNKGVEIEDRENRCVLKGFNDN